MARARVKSSPFPSRTRPHELRLDGVRPRRRHGYNDPAVSTPALRAFYQELAEDFPAQLEDEGPGTDYTIGKAVIYMTFEWDRVDEAYEAVFQLAATHGLGFFDVSSDLAETWLPDGKGGLYIAHSD